MALKRACQWDQPSTTFGLAMADPTRHRTQALELDPEPPLPFGWEKCFDLQTGVIFFKNTSTGIRTATDPRVQVKLQHYQQQKRDVESEAWRGPSRSLDTAALDRVGDKGMDWMDRLQKSRGLDASSTIDTKVSKWSQNCSSKKLPPLLSLKSTDSLPSLELSLRLEGPHAQDSSSGDKAGTFNDKVGHVKLEQLEQCRQNFLGPNHNMGPFPSNSINVKEEPTTTSLCWESPPVCNILLSTFPNSASSKREGTEPSAISVLEQPEFRDLLTPRYGAMGPFTSSGGHPLAEPMPSSVDQLAGTCTLDKVLMALERTQTQHETAAKSSSVSTKTGPQTSNSLALPNVGTKTTLMASPLLPPPPTSKLSAAVSLSPTTSDASSAVSSKSSHHSSTTPSVMSFQGEELDDLRGHGSSAEAKIRSTGLPTSTSSDPKGEDGRGDQITLVAVGCMSCHMFVMLSKNNPSCPRCGKTGLLDISPPRKKQRMENSPAADLESRRHWISSSPS